MSATGGIPWNKGKHGVQKYGVPWNKGLTKETDERVRRGAENEMGEKNHMFGKRYSKEKRKKMSEDRLGEKNPMFGKKHTDKSIKKMSVEKIGEKNNRWGKHHSDKTKKQIGESNTGKKRSDETKQKLREANIGKTLSEATIKKLLGRIPWNKGKNGLFHHTVETINKIIKNRKCYTPNGEELYLDYLLQNYFPDEWKYVGDGNCIINGLCPDFINVNGKKLIIELFGEYWHEGEKVPYKRTEDGRKEIFKQLGYNTLIIWSKELADNGAVVEKIRTFMQ
jgi:hypothetical protein